MSKLYHSQNHSPLSLNKIYGLPMQRGIDGMREKNMN